ncbi:hypothetical protein FAF44_18055 [Nonomuraea sp. MG754425]|uniref:hypothetical protein n=1 Tax=Nonomuraea sp. MG754425 TaxID=2570319 RepID=UPI001F223DD9|nr:hypothetical protein [Nonomuraea sp. MG754425]MCF6470288.1 hypothetical protein [Nonomuraea sp. MG754425]
MPERGLARSLVEAYVYLDLAAAGGSADAAVADEREGWVLRADGVEVFVPYDAEDAAQEEDATFGTGLSELLDAGQWFMISVSYASRALEGALFYAVGPPDAEAFDAVAADWAFAADAVVEALKFLPEETAELPPDAFWTEMGESARDAEPDRFTRERLESDLAFYRQSLADFRRLHAGDL